MSRNDVLKAVAMTPKLIVKLSFTYLRFKRRVKKAAKSFRKELIWSGMEKEMAKRLADEFLSSANFVSIRDLSGMF